MEEKRKPRVLVTYIESGYGHIMSAQAIAAGLEKKYSGEMDIVEANIMQEDHDETLIKFEKFLINQTKLTNKVRYYGDVMFAIMNLGKSKFMKLLHHTVFHKALESGVEAFRLRDPDVIISTHYFITFCAIEYKRRYAPAVTVVTYNPDNNVHVWWDKRSDIFITNNNKASTEAVRKRKFDFEKVKQVYFTARECVKNASGTKEEYRNKYHIPQEKFCVVLADGGYADGKAKKYVNALLRSKKPLTLVFMTGRNEKLFSEYTAKKALLSENITLIPVAFTEAAYELYAAADIFVTKAGPNSVLDSLYVGTPVMINYCPHPIERATYKLFVKTYGCGVGAFNRFKAKKMIERFIDDPTLLGGMRENIRANIDKTRDGASQIADIVYDQVRDAKET